MLQSAGRLLLQPARSSFLRQCPARALHEVVRWREEHLGERECSCRAPHAPRRFSSACFAAQVEQLPVEALAGAYDAQQIQAWPLFARRLSFTQLMTWFILSLKQALLQDRDMKQTSFFAPSAGVGRLGSCQEAAWHVHW